MFVRRKVHICPYVIKIDHVAGFLLQVRTFTKSLPDLYFISNKNFTGSRETRKIIRRRILLFIKFVTQETREIIYKTPDNINKEKRKC